MLNSNPIRKPTKLLRWDDACSQTPLDRLHCLWCHLIQVWHHRCRDDLTDSLTFDVTVFTLILSRFIFFYQQYSQEYKSFQYLIMNKTFFISVFSKKCVKELILMFCSEFEPFKSFTLKSEYSGSHVHSSIENPPSRSACVASGAWTAHCYLHRHLINLKRDVWIKNSQSTTDRPTT